MFPWKTTCGLLLIGALGVAFAPRLGAISAPSSSLLPRSPRATPPSGHADLVLRPVRSPGAPRVEPSERGPLRVHMDLDGSARGPLGTDERFLVVTVEPPPAPTGRRPVDLTLVIDTSGSMRLRDRIDHARNAARSLVAQLEPDDTFSLVTFDDAARVVVPAGPVRDRTSIEQAIYNVTEGGETHLAHGLALGVQQARSRAAPGRIGRMVLLSDGRANRGPTDRAQLEHTLRPLAAHGVSVSAVGLGLDFDEDSLDGIANISGGSYHFVDRPANLQPVFFDMMARTGDLIAQDAVVEVALPPHIELIEVMGLDDGAPGGPLRVSVGEVYAGTPRRVVARVRVRQGRSGPSTIDLGRASVHYRDVQTGAPRYAEVRSTARLDGSGDVGADHDATAGWRAWGGAELQGAVQHYRDGEPESARNRALDGAAQLERAAGQLDDPDLIEQATQLRAAAHDFAVHSPTSEPGRRRLKLAKEQTRATTR